MTANRIARRSGDVQSPRLPELAPPELMAEFNQRVADNGLWGTADEIVQLIDDNLPSRVEAEVHRKVVDILRRRSEAARLCATTGARCLGPCPCAEHARVAAQLASAEAPPRRHHFVDGGRGHCIYCGLDQKLNVNGNVPCRERANPEASGSGGAQSASTPSDDQPTSTPFSTATPARSPEEAGTISTPNASVDWYRCAHCPMMTTLPDALHYNNDEPPGDVCKGRAAGHEWQKLVPESGLSSGAEPGVAGAVRAWLAGVTLATDNDEVGDAAETLLEWMRAGQFTRVPPGDAPKGGA